MKVLTRREVIEAWNKDDRYHDFYVCPDCRDILSLNNDSVLQCKNPNCVNEDQYNVMTGERI